MGEIIKDKDPLVVYLIIRASLNMSTGKIGAQCGHGIQKLLLSYFNLSFTDKSEKDTEFVKLTSAWIDADSRKVSLIADDKEFERIKEDYPDHFLIKDNGLTEVEPGSETLICLRPMLKSTRSKILKRLQALK
jgi:peptidyl-tRNA hydrolase, PTH2 family